jgi:hypothetical protein
MGKTEQVKPICAVNSCRRKRRLAVFRRKARVKYETIAEGEKP